ncbi:MAG TPA: Ig-like domain-containing protein [Bryobacteraceae bacterium]|nr:Ig-like domain-containing protein [Bryobacteraceae bacterium]
MRTSFQKDWALAVSIVIASLVALGVGHAQVTNWVAYNDSVPNYTNPTNGWVTHPRATGHDMGEGTASGSLTNFLTGEQLPVTISCFHTGTPHAFGLAVRCNDNTPAAQIFKGIVDINNDGSAQPGGNVIGVESSAARSDYATFTISGLNPNKRYIFRGTGVRGGPYGLRWSVATIIGAQTWVDAHINGNGGAVAGVYTSNTYPASLGAGQAAWNAGDNKPGAVIGWDFITPAPDGTFSVQSSNYVGQIPGGTAANNTYSYAIQAMLLAEVELAPPVITQQPAAQTTVEQNRPFSLSVTASGTPLFYEWYKKGPSSDTKIPNATFATYSVSQAALSDSGDYYVVVYNPLDRKTSSVAHVTVNADVTGPGIATAFTYPTVGFATQVASLNQVIIEFNERIQSVGATDPARYVISGGIGNPASVILTNDSTVALQLSTALAEDTLYTVQVNGIIDLVGNDIANGGTNNPASFRSWVSGPGNSLVFEVYDGMGGETVPDLTSSPLYPNNPTFRTNLWVFDSRLAFPDDTREDYGSRIRGVFIPPVSGDWLFYMRGIDRCDLYLNPNGLDEAGKQFLRDEQQPDNDGNWGRVVSNPVSLRAGRGYYIETLHKTDTGTDFIKVAARLLGAGVPPGVPNIQLDTNAVYGAAIGAPLAPRDLGGTLTIAQGPANLTIEENHIATFSVQVNNPSGLPVSYKWYRDNVLITSNAFGPSYSFEATSADSGAAFRVEAAKIGSSALSGNATLTVVPDTTPPRATNVISSSTDLSTILVQYDEFVTAGTAGDPFSYGLPGAGVTGATLESNRLTATLVLGGTLVAGETYELSVSGITDLVGNGIVPDPTLLTFVAGGGLPRLRIELVPDYVNITWPAPSTGFVLQEADNLTGGAWTPVSTPPIVINGRNFVSLFTGPGNKFYRLQQ